MESPGGLGGGVVLGHEKIELMCLRGGRDGLRCVLGLVVLWVYVCLGLCRSGRDGTQDL